MIDLIPGDCIEKMQEIPKKSIDLILTDPPYGTTACQWDNVIPLRPMWEQIWRVLKPNGSCCLFGSEPFSSLLRHSQLKYFKYDWIWNKGVGQGLLAKKRPIKTHEIVSVFYKKQPLYNPIMGQKKPENARGISKTCVDNTKGNIMVKRSMRHHISGKTFPKSIISIYGQSKECNRLNRIHPTQKPVELLEYLIKTYTQEDETVLDFAMGSGSTGVACTNLNRNFIGIELDKEYFKIARKRIEEFNEA